jgi:Domain of unknown function (DUF4062)
LRELDGTAFSEHRAAAVHVLHPPGTEGNKGNEECKTRTPLIDLRWGITEDEATNEPVFRRCLEQIDECRPFFLAFLGHRYGWVPPRVPADVSEKYACVDRPPGVSVTELELRHGAINHLEGLRALALLRREETLQSIPEATRSTSPRFVYGVPRTPAIRTAARSRYLGTGP